MKNSFYQIFLKIDERIDKHKLMRLVNAMKDFANHPSKNAHNELLKSMALYQDEAGHWLDLK